MIQTARDLYRETPTHQLRLLAAAEILDDMAGDVLKAEDKRLIQPDMSPEATARRRAYQALIDEAHRLRDVANAHEPSEEDGS